MPERQNRDQIRAKHAYDCVRGVGTGESKLTLKEYASQIQTVAGTIRRGGLAVAAATLDRLKAATLQKHLIDSGIAGIPKATPTTSLSRVIYEMDAETYMIATREALAVAIWLKRAAEGVAATKGD